jgi:hypothetical protein
MKTKKSLTSPLDAELSGLRAKVARRREYLDLLEVELANTRAALLEFTQLYNTRIGPLEAEQKRLQELLDQMTADQAPPGNDWRGRKQEAKQKQNNHNNGYKRDEPIIEKKPVTNNDPDYERKVRALFRKLAKQYHPDMAQGSEDKKRHEEIMSEINQAYSVKDLEALEALANRNGHGSAGTGHGSPAAEIARLTTELQQLETMIFEVEHTIRELDLSHAMQMRSELKADQDDGRDALAELEAEFKTRIAILQEQLLAMGADLDSLIRG